MTLRLKFFVVVWLLIVAGLVALGTVLGRLSVVEIGRVSMAVQVEEHLDGVRDALTTALADAARDSSAVSRVLRAAVDRDSLLRGALLTDSVGRVLGSAFPSGGRASLTFHSDQSFLLRWVRDTANQRSEMVVQGNVLALAPLDQRFLILIPAGGPMPIDVRASAEERAGSSLVSRIMLAVLAGSILAALVTFAISGPLLGRVGELSRAAARLGQGERGVRVAVRGTDEVAELGRRFNTMTEDLERSEAHRRQMVTDVAHELRTPLTNITGLLEAIEDGLRDPGADTIAALREEAALLAGLVDDLRDLSLAESGHLRLTVEPVDLGAAVRRAIDGFDRRFAIAVDLPTEVVVVHADPRRVGQVIRNLIQNAATHSPEPGSVRVRLSPSPRGESVRITISDRGPGITADELPRIWDRFYRTDGSRSRATGGMGLGLPVARHLVTAMGGEIRVASVVGTGSEFEIEFPLPASRRGGSSPPPGTQGTPS